MSRCFTCGARAVPCLCPSIRPVPTRTFLSILMHPKEFKKERLGTGRMTHASLPSSEIRMGVDFSADAGVNALINDPGNFAVVLWPGEGAVPWEGDGAVAERAQGKRLVVFLLDGTWACARKMYRMSPNLQALPKLALAPRGPSEFLIKQQPDARCLATVEAAHLLFQTLEEHGLEERSGWNDLLVPFREMNARQLAISADPNRVGYRRTKGYDTEAMRARALAGTRARALF